jgi:hypothetical protein
MSEKWMIGGSLRPKRVNDDAWVYPLTKVIRGTNNVKPGNLPEKSKRNYEYALTTYVSDVVKEY